MKFKPIQLFSEHIGIKYRMFNHIFNLLNLGGLTFLKGHIQRFFRNPVQPKCFKILSNISFAGREILK